MKSLTTQLAKAGRPFFKKYESQLKDIVLFGSFVRGKAKPEDIDILLVFKTKVNKDVEYELKKLFSEYAKNISIIPKTEKECAEPSFDARESILFEGYSLINSKFLAEDFGFASFGLFFYDTKNMTNTKKTKFYYALNGRLSKKGVIDSLNAIKLSDNVIAVPLDKIESAKEFFEYWGIGYKYVPSLIPKRLGRKGIIGRLI